MLLVLKKKTFGTFRDEKIRVARFEQLSQLRLRTSVNCSKRSRNGAASFVRRLQWG